MDNCLITGNHRKEYKSHSLTVFGDVVESFTLVKISSLLCGPIGFYDISECITYISKSKEVHRTDSGDKKTIILHDPHHSSRGTKLIDILYELRFSLGWLSPVLIVACQECINDIESTDLFKVSTGCYGHIPQRCIVSPLLLGKFLNALCNLDGYGRFAWRNIQQYIRDKDLVREALELLKNLNRDLDCGNDMRTHLLQLRELLLKRQGALSRFLPNHGHLMGVNQLLSRHNLHFQVSGVPPELQNIINALAALPKVKDTPND